MDWQFEVLVHCNGVPGSCIVVPDHLQTYFRILQQNRVAFMFLYIFTLGVGACHQKHQNRENLLKRG